MKHSMAVWADRDEIFYGIHDTQLISAEGLDLIGADPEAILSETMEQIHI